MISAPTIVKGWSLDLNEHVRSLRWSPDATRALAGLADGRLCFLDAVHGTIQHECQGHALGVQQVAWSPDGEVVASGGEDGRVKWWRASDGFQWGEQDGGGGWVGQVAWAPDGLHLATTAGRSLRLWDKEAKLKQEWPMHDSTITGMHWRADGKAVASGSFGAVRLFRLDEAVPYENLAMKISFLSLAWSPNGRHVAAGTQENSIIYWRLPFREGEPLQMTGFEHKIKSVAWDRGSSLLATDGGPEICVWDVSGKGPAGRKPIRLRGHAARVTRTTFQQNGDFLASGCLEGAVWVWSPGQTAKGMKAAAVDSEITQLHWSPDGQRLLAGTADGAVHLIR